MHGIVAGIVRAVRIDNRLTVTAWDGHETRELTFSPQESLRPGDKRLNFRAVEGFQPPTTVELAAPND